MAGPIPSTAQRPIASFSAVVWAFSFFALGVIFGFSSQIVLMGICFVFALVGVFPTTEGPLYLHAYRKLIFHWKQWRMGTTWRRSISSTQMVLKKGVSPMRGLFKIEVVALEYVTGKGIFQIPAFLNQRRHTIMVETGTNPNSALADQETRLRQEEREASMYGDLAYELGAGNSFTIWSLRRSTDQEPTVVYLDERLEESLRLIETAEALDAKAQMLESHAEIVEPNWESRRGISFTAVNPPSWKVRKLDKLTGAQLQESPAVKAALLAEDKLKSLGIAEARVTSFPRFIRVMEEIFSIRNLEFTRRLTLDDMIAEDIAAMEGKRLDPDDMLSLERTPLPTQQREMGNDYLLFDGTYHRVMWVTNYFDTGDDPNAFDHLYTASCNYMVSIYVDLVRAEQDDSDRQDKGRLMDQVIGLSKRNKSASDEKALADLNAERYDVMRFGPYAGYFRTLVIVSAASYEELNECEAEIHAHLNRHSVRVQLHTIFGGDQLQWFFAALGSFGVSSR